MDNPEYDLFFDRFRELSKTKVYLSSDFSKIRADQESKNILNDYQSESHDNAFRVVLIFFVGTILCVLGLIFMRLVVIKGKSRKKKPKFTQILTQAENERLFLDRIKIEESIDKS